MIYVDINICVYVSVIVCLSTSIYCVYINVECILR